MYVCLELGFQNISQSLSRSFPDGCILCQISHWYKQWFLKCSEEGNPFQHPFQSYKRTTIGSAWVACPSLHTSPWFLQSGVLLWASLGHIPTSVGQGDSTERRLIGNSTSITEIEEEVVPTGKECEETRKKLVSTLYFHSPARSDVPQPILEASGPRVFRVLPPSSSSDHSRHICPVSEAHMPLK